MSAHTPGPWKFGPSPQNSARERYIHARGELIARASAGYIHYEEDGSTSWRLSEQELEANARLIAAAPELLEALTNLRQYCIAYGSDKDMAPWIEQADAAIAKAEGGES